jgi:hypothetical protein
MCCLAHTCRQSTRCSHDVENISSFEGHYCRALRTLSAPSFRVRNSPATQKAIICRTNHTQKRPSITRLRRSPTALPPSSTARMNMGRPKSTRRRLSSTPRPLASIPSKQTRSRSHRSNRHGRPGHTPAFRYSLPHPLSTGTRWATPCARYRIRSRTRTAMKPVRSKYWNGREPVGWRHQIAVPGDGRLFRTVRDAVSRGSMWGRGRQWIGRASWPT